MYLIIERCFLSVLHKKPMLWVLIKHRFLWRHMQNYPLIIIKNYQIHTLSVLLEYIVSINLTLLFLELLQSFVVWKTAQRFLRNVLARFIIGQRRGYVVIIKDKVCLFLHKVLSYGLKRNSRLLINIGKFGWNISKNKTLTHYHKRFYVWQLSLEKV